MAIFLRFWDLRVLNLCVKKLVKSTSFISHNEENLYYTVLKMMKNMFTVKIMNKGETGTQNSICCSEFN